MCYIVDVYIDAHRCIDAYILHSMQVFYMFNLYFQGVPEGAISDKEGSYSSVITQLKEYLRDTGDNVGSTHWRSVSPFLFATFQPIMLIRSIFVT